MLSRPLSLSFSAVILLLLCEQACRTRTSKEEREQIIIKSRLKSARITEIYTWHKAEIMRHIIINVKYCLMFTRAHHIKFSLYFRLNYVVILNRHRSLHRRHCRCLCRKRRHTAKNDYETLTMTTTTTPTTLRWIRSI